MQFDVLSASQGAASLGLVSSFAIAGSIVLAQPTEPSTAIGTALLVIAAIYFVAMMAIGKLARSGGVLDSRFNFHAGSHGASGFCIVGMFACSGVLTLKDLWGDSTALGVALLIVGGGCAVGMALFGRISCSSGNDNESEFIG